MKKFISTLSVILVFTVFLCACVPESKNEIMKLRNGLNGKNHGGHRRDLFADRLRRQKIDGGGGKGAWQ